MEQLEEIWDDDRDEKETRMKKAYTYIRAARIIMFITLGILTVTMVVLTGLLQSTNVTSEEYEVVGWVIFAVLILLTIGSYKKPFICILLLTILFFLRTIIDVWQAVRIAIAIDSWSYITSQLVQLLLKIGLFTFMAIATKKAREYEQLKRDLK